MTEMQTTLDAEVFGEDLQTRVERAREIRDEAAELYEAINEHRSGEWQPGVVDDAHSYAVMAIYHADEAVYESYLEMSEMMLEEAQWVFSDVVFGED